MLFGLITRRERWGLSVRGWLVLGAFAIATVIGVGSGLYRFLAVTDRTDANVLVVEGWIPDDAIHAACEEFRSGNYRKIYSTGGPLRITALYRDNLETTANLGALRLVLAGLPPDQVDAVPAPKTERDRTYVSALALRDRLRAGNIPVTALNIVTQAVHARRTRLLFEKAFGPNVPIGVIAAPETEYNPQKWWRYSKGVRDVLGETIGYVYARCFFFPGQPEPISPPHT